MTYFNTELAFLCDGTIDDLLAVQTLDFIYNIRSSFVSPLTVMLQENLQRERKHVILRVINASFSDPPPFLPTVTSHEFSKEDNFFFFEGEMDLEWLRTPEFCLSLNQSGKMTSFMLADNVRVMFRKYGLRYEKRFPLKTWVGTLTSGGHCIGFFWCERGRT